MVAGQKIALGRIHAGQVVTVHAAAETITIDLGEDTRTVRRTTTQPVRSIKAAQSRGPPVSPEPLVALTTRRRWPRSCGGTGGRLAGAADEQRSPGLPGPGSCPGSTPRHRSPHSGDPTAGDKGCA